ncbi:hypothetical protein [Pseudoxanthomonas sp. 10H]|uniref:hypothetical protein n=1 Tax=Pseudoxanthomonas sp. 10H TaxID=3242729 RepID=UPI003555EA47
MASGGIKKVERGSGWIVALVLACAGLAVVRSLVGTASLDPSYLLGQSLVHGLLVFAVFYLVFLRRGGARRALVALFALWMSLFVGALVAARGHGDEAEQALSAMQADLHDFAKASTDANGVPVPVAVPTDTGPTAGGVMGQAQALHRTMLAELMESRNTYLNTLSAMGWERILDADRLKADAGMQESLAMLAKAEAAITAQEVEYTAVVGRLKGRIDALDLSERDKAAMWAGVQDAVARGQPDVQESFRLERAAVQEFRNIVELLGRSEWEAEGGQVMFHADADMVAFNEFIQAINGHVARQQAIQASTLAKFDANVEALKDQVR